MEVGQIRKKAPRSGLERPCFWDKVSSLWGSSWTNRDWADSSSKIQTRPVDCSPEVPVSVPLISASIPQGQRRDLSTTQVPDLTHLKTSDRDKNLIGQQNSCAGNKRPGLRWSPKLTWVSGSWSVRWGPDKGISKTPFQLRNEFVWLEFWETMQKFKVICLWFPSSADRLLAQRSRKDSESRSPWL